MSRRSIAVVAGAAAAILLGSIVSLAARAPRVGELGLFDSRLVARSSREPFDAAAWRSGDPRVRGAMVADLLRRNRFVGLDRDSVAAFLGGSTCYGGQEYFNCYLVELDGRLYELNMVTTHEGETRHVVVIQLNQR